MIAVWIARQTMNNADKQFKLNMQTSDSLFKVQLANSKSLNDNLISQIKELQLITKDQLKITRGQLSISTQTLKEKLISEQPRIDVSPTMMEDTNIIIDGKFSPVIKNTMMNNGHRTAYNVVIRNFLIDRDYFDVRIGNVIDSRDFLDPDNGFKNRFAPKIVLPSKDNFYYCYELTYYDSLLNKSYKLTAYQHYNSFWRMEKFKIANVEEKRKLKEFINTKMKEFEEPPFDE